MAPVNTSYKKSSFGPAFLFLSKKRRQALADYYEFCRLADDIADEKNRPNPKKELDELAQEIKRIYNAQEPVTSLGRQLAATINAFGLEENRFLLLLEGMRADLEGKQYLNFEELEWYLYRVAIIVGMATLDILDVKGPQAESLAKDLGAAIQLTNIIRDVPDDATLGRVYLPQDLLEKNKLTRQDVLDGNKPQDVAPVLQRLDSMAQKLYARAFEKMKALPRLKMLPCRMMGCVYRANLAKIRKTGFRFAHPIKLTKTEKIKGVLYAFFQTVFC